MCRGQSEFLVDVIISECVCHTKIQVLLAFLRLALEGLFFFDECLRPLSSSTYGRRLLPKSQWSYDPLGTFGYVLAELFITVVAAWPSLPPDIATLRRDLKVNLLGNVVVADVMSNRGGINYFLLWHWGYLFVSDVYLKSKMRWLFHTAHFMGFVIVPAWSASRSPAIVSALIVALGTTLWLASGIETVRVAFGCGFANSYRLLSLLFALATHVRLPPPMGQASVVLMDMPMNICLGYLLPAAVYQLGWVCNYLLRDAGAGAGGGGGEEEYDVLNDVCMPLATAVLLLWRVGRWSRLPGNIRTQFDAAGVSFAAQRAAATRRVRAPLITRLISPAYKLYVICNRLV